MNTGVTYYVFLQAHGPSTIYNSVRGTTSFTVKVKPGDADCAFSYRIVAKRLKHETQRLTHIPSLDSQFVPGGAPKSPSRPHR